jgi:hypothetical protein
MQSLHARRRGACAFSLAFQKAGGGMLIADRVVDPSPTRRSFFMASSRKRSGRASEPQTQRDPQRQPRDEPKRQSIESPSHGERERSPSVNQPMPREDRSGASQPEQDERESRRPGGSGDRSIASER